MEFNWQATLAEQFQIPECPETFQFSRQARRLITGLVIPVEIEQSITSLKLFNKFITTIGATEYSQNH